MTIRPKKDKDHLKASAPLLVAVPVKPADEDPLLFLTKHPSKPFLVDLRPFSTGETHKSGNTGGSWEGPFTARPALIVQLAPALKDRLCSLSEKSARAYLNSLRGWWRLLDAAEAAGEPIVSSVAQLTNVHRQLAYDRGMLRVPFTLFLGIVDLVRQAMRLPKLYWQPPSDSPPKRFLPPQWQSEILRQALKRDWYAVVDRWELADLLRAGGGQTDAKSEALRMNYHFYAKAQARLKHPLPKQSQLMHGFTTLKAFYDTGLKSKDMVRGLYPDGDDIRAAFHLCLSTTGWNPAVLLNLDIETNYIEAHPKDPERFILRSTKAKADDEEMTTEGLFKTQAGAGFIIKLLIDKTEPLRRQLRVSLREIRKKISGVTDPKKLLALQLKQSQISRAIRSPWLYVGQGTAKWLDDNSFARGGERNYLRKRIERLNKALPPDRQLAIVQPSDFRDIFAADVYRISGGSMLALKRALGHRGWGSPPKYVTNTLIREEHRKLFMLFSNSLWNEIKETCRIDPTILAKLSRDREATQHQRQRLEKYRTIPITRMGTGCSDPHNPPKHIDPDFVPDGRKLCEVQRCLLCTEHAVIFPESIDGLARRSVELRSLNQSMNIVAWETSTFREELDNIEFALKLFEPTKVEQLIEKHSEESTCLV